jgi:hypothetical protein
MSKRRFTGKLAATALGLGIGALLAAGPALAQGGGPMLSLSPSTVAPGGSVQAEMVCAGPVDAPIVVFHYGDATLTGATGVEGYVYRGTLNVPSHTPHGTYTVDSPCGHASLVVGPGGVGPRGGTGLDADNGALLAAGAGTLAAAGLGAGGVWLLRRRREADAPVA